jgi:hypothetical protein
MASIGLPDPLARVVATPETPPSPSQPEIPIPVGDPPRSEPPPLIDDPPPPTKGGR